MYIFMSLFFYGYIMLYAFAGLQFEPETSLFAETANI